MSLLQATPQANLLRDALQRVEPDLWGSAWDAVELGLGEVLHEPGVAREFVYFPGTAVISLLSVLPDGKTAEIAVVGNEGLVGLSLFSGQSTASNRALVQRAGRSFRLRATTLDEDLHAHPQLALVLLSYSHALALQISQTVVCNRHHSVDQNLCRWLLLMVERSASEQVHMTQEFAAFMLGVRRESVSVAAAKLQQSGAITYRRGVIDINDRALLEHRACECFGVLNRANRRWREHLQ